MRSMRLLAVAALVVVLALSSGLPTAHGGTSIAFDATANANCSICGTTISWSHTVGVGSNRILIVGVSDGSPVGTLDKIVNTVTYGGTPLALAAAQLDPSDTLLAEMWYLLNPPPGTATIQVTFAGNPSSAVGGSVSYFNVAGIGNFNSANGAGSSASVTVNANDGDLVVDTLASSQNGPFPSPGAGQTQHWNVVVLGAHVGAGSDKAASSPVTMTWSPITTGNWALVAVDLQPPAPVGPVGGVVEPANKLAVFAPYLALFGVIGAVAVIVWKRPDN